MSKVEMSLEQLAKLIITYCKASHISEDEKYEFVIETLKEVQRVCLEKQN